MSACTAIYVIVAWRTLYACRLGRSCPDVDCETRNGSFFRFALNETPCVARLDGLKTGISTGFRELDFRPFGMAIGVVGDALRRAVADNATETLRNATMDRKPRRPRDSPEPPGIETVWKGLQRTRDLARAWQTFGPGAKPN